MYIVWFVSKVIASLRCRHWKVYLYYVKKNKKKRKKLKGVRVPSKIFHEYQVFTYYHVCLFLCVVSLLSSLLFIPRFQPKKKSILYSLIILLYLHLQSIVSDIKKLRFSHSKKKAEMISEDLVNYDKSWRLFRKNLFLRMLKKHICIYSLATCIQKGGFLDKPWLGIGSSSYLHPCCPWIIRLLSLRKPYIYILFVDIKKTQKLFT